MVTGTLEQRRLGRTGMVVTALGLGSYQLTRDFGVSPDDAAQIFELAATAGVNYVDTAPVYAGGESEKLLGRAFSTHPTWRPGVSTKVGYLASDDDYRDPRAIRRSIESSYARLGVERLDIVMIHEPEIAQWNLDQNGNGPVTEALMDLRSEGMISHIGLGGWMDLARITAMIDSGLFDVALVAGGYTLLHQPIRDEILPAAERHDVGIIVGGAFAQGEASGLLTIDREPIQAMLRSGDFATSHPFAHFDQRTCERLLNLYDLAEDLGIQMTELTIRYLLGEPRIHSHVAGARERAHLQANVEAALKGPFDEDILTRIEQA